MAVAQQVLRGPQVLRAVGGKTLKFNAAWRNPTVGGVRGSVIDSSDYTAQLQIRDAQNSRRVLLDVAESGASDAVLSRYTHTNDDLTTEERFLIVLGKSYTSWFPENIILECELVSDSNPDDAVPLFSFLVKVSPQEVM